MPPQTLVNPFEGVAARTNATLDRIAELNAQYRAGEIHAQVPDALHDSAHSLDELIEHHLPLSHGALKAAARSLFFSLPVAFNPAEAVGPYLASVDRDAEGRPYRFLDMGALIATQAFGENEPAVVRAILAADDPAAATRELLRCIDAPQLAG